MTELEDICALNVVSIDHLVDIILILCFGFPIDFLNQLDREERRSCEELKRRRSNGEGSAAIVKYRR